MKGTRLALALAVPLLTGCVEAVTAPDRELPEARGTQVGAPEAVSTAAAIAWSADGAALYYRSTAEPPALAVAGVAGGAVRDLVTAFAAHRDMRSAADGRSLYFVADTGATALPVAFRLPLEGGAPVALGRTTPAVAAPSAALGAPVLPLEMPDSALVVIRPDSVLLIGPETRTFMATGCERLVDLSPDGTRALCLRSAATGEYRVIDLATGTVGNVAVRPAAAATLLDVVWGEDGIRSLYVNAEGWSVHDATDDADILLQGPPAHGFVADARYGALSRDGRTAAWWVHTCVEAGPPGSCARGQSVLYVAALAAPAPAVAAVATGTAPGGALAFAPDGRSIAYVFEGTLYRVPVP